METVDQVIARISGHQAGAFTVTQAQLAGISRDGLGRWVRRGAGHRLHPGTYVAGPVWQRCETLRWGAVLAGGDDALLSGAAAEDVWGIGRWPSDAVEILVTKRQRPLHGVTIVQTRTLDPEDVEHRDGMPITSVERTLLELAARRTVHQLQRSLREAAFHRLLDVERLERTIERNRNRQGIGRLRRALHRHLEGDGGTDSGYEDRFVRLLRRAGITDVATNATLEIGGETLRVDVLIERLDLVVEIDPDGHDIAPMRREDKLRSALCRLAGYRHLRVRGHDLRGGVDAVLAMQRQASHVRGA